MTIIRVRMAAAGGLVALLLAGCGVGQDAATARDLPSIAGIDMEDAGVAVRNAAVVFDPAGYGTGDTAPVELWVVNDTDQEVTLVSASSSAAGSVTVQDGEVLVVPPYGLASATLALTGLRESLDGTSSVPLELNFDNGASFSMNLPVAPPQVRVGERTPSV